MNSQTMEIPYSVCNENNAAVDMHKCTDTDNRLSTFPLSVGTQNNKTKRSDVGVQRAELLSQAGCVCVCMVLLKLSKQFIRVRWMTYLERFKFPHCLLQNTLQTM